VGFGIKDPETARQVGRVADAVVVGSAVVRRIAEHRQDIDKAGESIAALIADMRAALDGAAVIAPSRTG
jgi:tryptophan synthase alpha chain